MFFKGTIFEFTYNKHVVFSHSQLAICYEVSQKMDPDSFRRIKMLILPPTIKYDTFIFDPDLPKYHYIKVGFK